MAEPYWLKEIKLRDFKNAAATELVFSHRINALAGKNGSGKTNILEAIHFLCLTKGYFSQGDSFAIRHETPGFYLEGLFQRESKEETVVCKLPRGGKKSLKRNGKEYSKLAEHIGTFPLVMVSPADRDLILEGPETRRRFMDAILAQSDPSFMHHWTRYNRALEARNLVLKNLRDSGGVDLLEVYDHQLVEHGVFVANARKALVDKLLSDFQAYYEAISGGSEEVSLVHESHFSHPNPLEVIRDARPADLAAGFSTRGVHRDDFDFMLDGHPLKRVGSQGQQKSYLVALKLAQFAYLKQVGGQTPLLLLDDVFDKLDHSRVASLIYLVGHGDFGQIFLTDTEPERLKHLIAETQLPARLYRVERNGMCHAEE